MSTYYVQIQYPYLLLLPTFYEQSCSKFETETNRKLKIRGSHKKNHFFFPISNLNFKIRTQTT